MCVKAHMCFRGNRGSLYQLISKKTHVRILTYENI